MFQIKVQIHFNKRTIIKLVNLSLRQIQVVMVTPILPSMSSVYHVYQYRQGLYISIITFEKLIIKLGFTKKKKTVTEYKSAD